MAIRRYTVETLRSGQSRPYADSEYEHILTVEYAMGSGEIQPASFASEQELMRVAKCLMSFKEKNDEGVNWASKMLVKKEQLSKGKWRFVCVAAYTG